MPSVMLITAVCVQYKQPLIRSQVHYIWTVDALFLRSETHYPSQLMSFQQGKHLYIQSTEHSRARRQTFVSTPSFVPSQRFEELSGDLNVWVCCCCSISTFLLYFSTKQRYGFFFFFKEKKRKKTNSHMCMF